ncbi:hypothetical protein ACQJBY_000190 [Aegilops geniculata]
MASSPWEKWPDHVRDKWGDDLRDIDFWFNGYHKTPAYIDLVRKLGLFAFVGWNVGVGPMASFKRAISGLAVEGIMKYQIVECKHVIKVDLKPTLTTELAQGRGFMSIKYQLAIAAAKELGLLSQYYNELKEKQDELQYFSYGSYDDGTSDYLVSYIRVNIVHRIGKQLSAGKYLLVVDNLRWPIERGSFTRDCGLPLLPWTDSSWLISATTHDAYNKSKSQDDRVISIDKDDQVVLLTLSAMYQSAEHILNTINQESKDYWHHIALQCFHYVMAFYAKHSQLSAITSDELIHHWAAQGILPCMAIREEGEETSTINTKCSNMHRVGRVILEAFHKYSLLQLPFSHATEAYEVTNTGAQFLAYHGLITESITVDELFDNMKKWISFAGDRGLHVSREWLRPKETRCTTALILRGCSHQSPILSKMDHFLSKLCFLRALDLSYTPIKVLPSSIHCLQNLRLLSLRGCHDLKTLSSSPKISVIDSSTNTSSYSPLSTLYQLEILDMNGVPCSHLTQDVANQKSNLIHLDMSYSKSTTFPPNFFQDMSNLEVLILTSCSNLLELPPSMASLSNLMTVEVTGTQIKYFPQMVFEEILKLQSLKLIDNNELVSLTRPISRAQGIKLEGHPNLLSFVLIGAPRIRYLSLCGCTKLESVEIKNLGALEELDLSCTAIKELPSDVPNAPQLRKLLLVGVPSLRRFPWHKLVRLPEVFYLDHCSEGNGNHTNQVTQVCVTDPRFFHSFRDTAVNFVRDGRFLQSFYVRVAPCITNSRGLQDEETMLDSKLQELVQKQLTYVDVHNSCYVEEIAITSQITVPLNPTERHMEIMGTQWAIDGLWYLLSVTKSISLSCDTAIYYFFPDKINCHELEECELRWCHKMKGVVYGTHGFRKLRNMHVCNLKRLVWFCERTSYCDFSRLEHLHLEDCPRLEHVVPDRATLPYLKTLDILFCYNLKIIFLGYYTVENAYQLPSLRRIRLQELPLLQHLQEKDMTITAPMWKELHIRGCWSLQRLPLLEGHQPETVKVNGERSWWSKLQWGSPLHRNNYDPKFPPQFASFDERAEMSSYLR